MCLSVRLCLISILEAVEICRVWILYVLRIESTKVEECNVCEGEVEIWSILSSTLE